MTNVNGNNYANSEALLKRLQMKNLMDEKKEDVQKHPEGKEETTTQQPTCSENNAGAMQALDYQALMNSTLVQNMKVNNAKFTPYTLNSSGTTFNINGEDVLVTGKGSFDIAIEGNNVVIKAGKGASSITFNNTQDLNITVEKSTKDSSASFNLTTGAGNDTVVVKEGAIVKNINTGKGDDVVINAGKVTQIIKAGEGDDTVINLGSANDIYGEGGNDAILNKGTVQRNITGDAGDDIIQNDGTIKAHIYGNAGQDEIVNNNTVKGNIYGDAGDDKIVNMGTAKSIDAGKGTDVIIDGNTVKFEKATNNITLGENDKAVINEDGSVTVTINDVEANKQTVVKLDKTGTEISREENNLDVQLFGAKLELTGYEELVAQRNIIQSTLNDFDKDEIVPLKDKLAKAIAAATATYRNNINTDKNEVEKEYKEKLEEIHKVIFKVIDNIERKFSIYLDEKIEDLQENLDNIGIEFIDSDGTYGYNDGTGETKYGKGDAHEKEQELANMQLNIELQISELKALKNNHGRNNWPQFLQDEYQIYIDEQNKKVDDLNKWKDETLNAIDNAENNFNQAIQKAQKEYDDAVKKAEEKRQKLEVMLARLNTIINQLYPNDFPEATDNNDGVVPDLGDPVDNPVESSREELLQIAENYGKEAEIYENQAKNLEDKISNIQNEISILENMLFNSDDDSEHIRLMQQINSLESNISSLKQEKNQLEEKAKELRAKERAYKEQAANLKKGHEDGD